MINRLWQSHIGGDWGIGLCSGKCRKRTQQLILDDMNLNEHVQTEKWHLEPLVTINLEVKKIKTA